MNPFESYDDDGDPTADLAETVRDAKHKLNTAIQEYCDLLGQQYVMNWVLAVDIATPKSERAGIPVVGIITPTDQQFVATRGLIAIANDEMNHH